MEWIQLIATILTFVGLFMWNRTESRADIRHMDQKMEASRQEFLSSQRETRELIATIHREILHEMKDFHGRLCAIEERRLKSGS